MKTLKSCHGESIIVDEDIFFRFKSTKFYLMKGYAMMSKWCSIQKKNKNYLISRLIMNAEKGQIVDHINGNKLDNRRENLHLGTQSQNMLNPRNQINSNNSLGVRGVIFWNQKWSKRKKNYIAHITKNYKTTNLGYFKTLDEAIEARKKAEVTL